MKVIYTILLFLNAASLTIMFILLFSEIEQRADMFHMLAVVFVILVLIFLLFFWIIRYFRIPSGRRAK